MIENMTKDEVIEMFGSINACGATLGKTRQAIYQMIDSEGVSTNTLTDEILGWAFRSDNLSKLPDRWIEAVSNVKPTESV